ncbi:phosphonate ABC transporter substrate-binding protein [Leptolyngbya sp. 'hensonii']|uniref:phosphate/phosphite/phosphonate ABC transporter substrate-binding protein n=1 Tax=Leptolyngbya sp. 'hensonii' TaxID=1922337 RepID=UPI00094F66E0|nr:PhnD/SsuA/transferrin family substrate-binding protein [Leptolyngbya sp. 'hensonii']OLP19083.1 phosphonate ABC transporter substrate-binding protein [Leptolyngbya sp. 'hensonii']
MVSRRLFLAQSLLFLGGCALTRSTQKNQSDKLVIGGVAYGEGTKSIDQYQRFIQYLGNRVKALIELEPAYNEVKALEQIERQVWSLVFAPAGLAAIATSRHRYVPLFSLQGVTNLHSVLVVAKNSPIQKLTDLNGKRIALGQPGSATGYYVPLYDLYGISLAEILISATPKGVLEKVSKGEVTAGALAQDEFERYRSEFSEMPLRILQTSRRIPPGSVLISPNVESRQRDLIQQAMNEALPSIAQEVGYIPNAPVPDYQTLTGFIDKVKPIEDQVSQKPAQLYKTAAEKKVSP